jgi:lipopolysaccharide biosynthesis glycosyltransferase
MDNNAISVTLGGDHNYFIGIYVTAHSICQSADPGSCLVLHVYDAGLDDEDRRILKSLEGMFPGKRVRVHMFKPDLKPFESFPKYHGSYATFARLLLQDLIPDEWTIYVDVDLLWLRRVNELWNMRDPAYAIFAVPDGSGFPEFSEAAKLASEHFPMAGGKPPPQGEYYGAGVVMLNLAKMREIGFSRRVLEMIPKMSSIFTYNDQDFYNFLMPCPLAKLIDPRWNTFACHWGTYGTDNQVIHYAGWIPWKNPKMRRVIMMWWDYLASIGWETFGTRGNELRRGYEAAKRRYKALCNPLMLGFLRIFRHRQWRKRMLRIVPAVYDPVRNDWMLP